MIIRIRDDKGAVVYKGEGETQIVFLDEALVTIYPGQTMPLKILPNWRLETEE